MAEAGRAVLYPEARPSPATGQRRFSWRSWLIGLFVWLLVGLAVGWLLGHYRIRLPLPSGSALWFIAGFFLSLWPHVLLHEAGHALAGRLAGMRLMLVSIGRWRLQRQDGRWRRSRQQQISGIGGFAAMIPPEGRDIPRAGTALFMLGGILANLASAAALWLAAQQALALPGALRALLGGAACMALLLALVNLLPLTSHSWQSDGRQLLNLLRGDADALRYLQLQRISALSFAGIRPRDWPAPLQPQPDVHPAESFTGQLCEVLYGHWLLDTGQPPAQADFWPRLVRLHARLPDGYRQYAALTLAEYASRQLHDAELAAAWRNECEGGLIDLAPYRAVLDAEIAALTGDSELPALIAAAERLLPNASDPASRLTLQERLNALQSACT